MKIVYFYTHTIEIFSFIYYRIEEGFLATLYIANVADSGLVC